MSLHEVLRQRKASKLKGSQGKVVSSYYGADDMQRIQAIAEREGVAPGGIQHQATILFVEGLEREHAKEQSQMSTLEARSRAHLQKIAEEVKKEAEAEPQKTIFEQLKETTQ